MAQVWVTIDFLLSMMLIEARQKNYIPERRKLFSGAYKKIKRIHHHCQNVAKL